jgi:hypothetical protein
VFSVAVQRETLSRFRARRHFKAGAAIRANTAIGRALPIWPKFNWR